MTNYLLQHDAEKNAAMGGQVVKANQAVRDKKQEQQKGIDMKDKITQKKDLCHRCNKYTGHWANDCPLKDLSLWYCYGCQRYAEHNSNSNNCPNKGKPRIVSKGDQDKSGNKSNNNKNTNTTIRKQRKKNYRHTPYHQQNLETTSNVYKLGKELAYNDKINDDLLFIADSGATEHIIKKAFILKEFVKSKKEVIKSANKNKKADIKIDGKGNLYLTSDKVDKTIKLTNVIAAKDAADNLLSLRKFADQGFEICMNDKSLRIYDKNTNEDYIVGTYQKPNWLISLRASNVLQKSDVYEVFQYTARMVDLDDFESQARPGSQPPKGTKRDLPAELGRESGLESIPVPDVTETSIETSIQLLTGF